MQQYFFCSCYWLGVFFVVVFGVGWVGFVCVGGRGEGGGGRRERERGSQSLYTPVSICVTAVQLIVVPTSDLTVFRCNVSAIALI